jgi:hypothetical protein
MIEIDFEKFHNHDYREKGYDLYVMKNGLGDPLYVGISTRSIWELWFGMEISSTEQVPLVKGSKITYLIH